MKQPALNDVLIGTLTGTTAMTVFSYAASQIEKENFREPELLATLLTRITNLTKKQANIAGFGIHYFVGLGFNCLYRVIWNKRLMLKNTQTTLGLGIVSGIAGALTWKTVLALHPNPPAVKLRKFLPHLLAAHLVFAAASALTQRKGYVADGAQKPNAALQKE